VYSEVGNEQEGEAPQMGNDAMENPAAGDQDGPIVLVGYAKAWLTELSKFVPDRSIVFVEEPDVIRKRSIREGTAGARALREVIDWEFHLEPAADCFYHRHRDLSPSAVIPVVEYAVPFAARLAERYGRPGAGYGAARLLRDKHLLRQVTTAAGIPNPRSMQVHGPDEVKAFMAEVGGTIVLKPANRQAAVGTKIITDPADIEASWVECTDQDEGVFVPDRPMPLRMLAEQFVRGEEFSVEMMISGGRPVFGAPTRKFLFPGPRPVEQGHLHPADIDPELSARLVADTARVLDAVGMDSGFVHCEWMVADGVPYLIECAGRMAGDGIIELVIYAWQYDVVPQYIAMMQGKPLGPVPGAPSRHAAAWLSRAAVGVVESVDGVEEAKAIPGVHTLIAPEAGEQIHELRSSWDRPAFVTAEGATPAEALAAARGAIDRIVVKIRPGVS
jgi:biotin carboxylase